MKTHLNTLPFACKSMCIVSIYPSLIRSAISCRPMYEIFISKCHIHIFQWYVFSWWWNEDILSQYKYASMICIMTTINFAAGGSVPLGAVVAYRVAYCEIVGSSLTMPKRFYCKNSKIIAGSFALRTPLQFLQITIEHLLKCIHSCVVRGHTVYLERCPRDYVRRGSRSRFSNPYLRSVYRPLITRQ